MDLLTRWDSYKNMQYDGMEVWALKITIPKVLTKVLLLTNPTTFLYSYDTYISWSMLEIILTDLFPLVLFPTTNFL